MVTNPISYTSKDMQLFLLIAQNKATGSHLEELFNMHKGVISKFIIDTYLINSIPREEVIRGIFNDSLLIALENLNRGAFIPKNTKFLSYIFLIYKFQAAKVFRKKQIQFSQLPDYQEKFVNFIGVSYEKILDVLHSSIDMLTCSELYKQAFLEFFLLADGSQKAIADKYGLKFSTFRTQYSRYKPLIIANCISQI